MNDLNKQVTDFRNEIGYKKDNFEVNSTEFEVIIDSLRNNKAIGFSEISNEMIKYGGKIVRIIIKKIVEKIIQFGKFPNFFNVGKIIPILKDDKGKNNDLNNIRPITVSDAIANIFEKIILAEAQKTHVEHKLQFGFKKNSSCNHAIFVFKETANYYNSKNKPIFACAIDASKAFDKVNRIFMMQKLIGKINPLIWRALYEYYLTSLAYVYNDNEYSIIFKTTVGVKQGGPLSPWLFSVYVEDLITEIERTPYGTLINGIKTGVIMYADDLLVMSDSVEKLQLLLNIIENYCKNFEIKINANKTQYIRIGPKNNKNQSHTKLKLNNDEITEVSKIKYLGVWINSKLNSSDHIDERRSNTVKAFNALRKTGITDFCVNPDVKSFMYKVYCRPILFYGIENMNLSQQDLKQIQTTESTLIKYALNLYKTVKSKNLLKAINLELVEDRVKELKMNFFLRLMKNDTVKNVINILIDEFVQTENKKLVKKSILKEISVFTEQTIPNKNTFTKIVLEKVKIYKKLKKSVVNCGVVDSIKFCLKNRTNENDKLLKPLVQSYEKVRRNELT